MLFVGVDLSAPLDAAAAAALDGPALLRRVRRLRVENSWGAELGDLGHQTMTAQWFREYVFHAAVDARYLPRATLAALQTTPTTLPYWDPLGSTSCHHQRADPPEENAAHFGRAGVRFERAEERRRGSAPSTDWREL